jgi:hypothetical protein
MRIKTLAFIGAVAFMYGQSYSQQNDARVTIAVNDLKGSGVDQATAAIVSDRLRSELVNSGVFRVMEREEMENILKEQGFQQSGGCDEASCLVQVGRLLGVQRMVAGSIGKVENFWTMSLRMLNVTTAEILFTVDEDFEGDIKGLISQVIAKAAVKLASGAGQEVKKAAMAGKKGDLYIESSQPGAAVEIDGMPVNNVTPLTLQDFTAGDHRIVVRKGGWFGSKTVTLNPDELLKVSIPMEQGKGSIKIFSTPSNATVAIDGRAAGETPLKLENLPVGEHEFTISKDGYISATQSWIITVDETQNLTVTLGQAATLSVTIQPAVATLAIDGKPVQGQSTENMTVPAGEVEIQAEAVDYDAFRQKIFLSPGEKKTLNIRLTSVFGTLKVSSNPPGAEVCINEKRVGVTPYENAKLMQCNYLLKVSLPGYDNVTENLSVLKERITDKHYDLIHTKAFLDSTAEAAKAARKRGRWARRIIFGVLAAGAGGTGAVFNAMAQQHIDNMNRIQDDYAKATSGFDTYQASYSKEKEDAKVKVKTRDLLYGLAGAFGGAFVISIPF